jgi:hypothetical protein
MGTCAIMPPVITIGFKSSPKCDAVDAREFFGSGFEKYLKTCQSLELQNGNAALWNM